MDRYGGKDARRSTRATESAIAAVLPSPSANPRDDADSHNVRYGGSAPGGFTSAATEDCRASHVDVPSGGTPASSTRGGTVGGSTCQPVSADTAAAAAAADALSTLDRRSTNSLAASLAPSHGWSTTATVARPRSVVSEPLDGITEGSASSDVGGGAASTADGGPPSPCYAAGGVEAHTLAQPPSPQAPAPRLPPRLVVFQPDGLFDIGIDPRRRHLLKPSRASLSTDAAAEVAALRQRQTAAALAQVEEEGEAMLVGWQRAYSRQKVLLLVCLLVDFAYLVALVVVRCVWSSDGSAAAAAEFFIGDRPDSLPITFLAAALITDGVAALAALRDWGAVITLFVLWSIVLLAFAIVIMLMLAAFQVRFSLARLRQLLPPSGVADWVSSGWAGITRGAAGAWAAAAALFRPREPRGAGAAAREAGQGPQPGSHRELEDTPRQQPSAAAHQARTQHARRHAGALAAADTATGADLATHVAIDVERLEGPAPGSAGPGQEAGGGAGRRVSRRSRDRRSARQRQEQAADGATDSLDRLYAQLMQELEAAASSDLVPGSRRRRRSRRRSNSVGADGLPAAAGAASGLQRGGSLELPRAVDVQVAEDPWARYQSVVFLQLAGIDGPHVLFSQPTLPRRRRQATPPLVPLLTVEPPPLDGGDASSASAVAAAGEGEAAGPSRSGGTAQA